MKRLFLAVVALVAVTISASAVAIVPQPLSISKHNNTFVLLPSTMLVCDVEEFAPIVKYSQEYLALDHFAKVAPKSNYISLALDKSLVEEEYHLSVSRDAVQIVAGGYGGAFYAMQTLFQLLPSEVYTKQMRLPAVVKGCDVKDKPKFAYRGFMLDVARTFMTKENVLRYIDYIAYHKINKLHWHLTDGQGWRIEIKKYPELTKVGSVRKETLVGLYTKKNRKFDGKPYGGFYTQDEVREVVRYASERYIDVIPEIDMPGHMVAALASYPHLGCTGGPYEVRTLWGISRDILCAGRESTFEFVEGVLAEVLELFPSKYIHIGGDEAPKHRWKACPECQKRIQEEGLKDEHELQSYFTHRVEKFLAKHGRRLIGWDEILEGGISKTATIMAWRGANRGIKAAQLGNEVIMTPRHYCYLDYCQTSDHDANNEPICGAGNGKRYQMPIRKVYSFDPYDQLNEEQRKAIVGVQGNMWTEYVATFDHVQHMVLPRIAALAEVGWTYGEKNYDEFARRMHLLRKLYDKCGYKYAPYFFNGIE